MLDLNITDRKTQPSFPHAGCLSTLRFAESQEKLMKGVGPALER